MPGQLEFRPQHKLTIYKLSVIIRYIWQMSFPVKHTRTPVIAHYQMYVYAPRQAHMLQHLSYAEYEGYTVHTQKCNVLRVCVFEGEFGGGGGW